MQCLRTGICQFDEDVRRGKGSVSRTDLIVDVEVLRERISSCLAGAIVGNCI
jgi:predicted transcriptional regulator